VAGAGREPAGAAVSDDPRDSAKLAGLRYVSDRRPGIRRRRRGAGFQYTAPDGSTVSDRGELERIRALAIPPAWTEVWICCSAKGHLQATGRDARGRKQYRYHPRWREVRDQTKYHRTLAFGRALPHIRREISKHLTRTTLSRERVLAAVVRLLDETTIRVGNDEYARQNGSYGLTTIRESHVDVEGARLCFRFRGKSGKMHDIAITDARVARVVRGCQDLPGQELFAYLGEDGDVIDVDSTDVNDYIREISGDDFTAKDFRTWTGTVLAAWALHDLGVSTTKSQATKQIVSAVDSVARKLGNTPAVCRKCYVHPDVFEAHLDGALASTLAKHATEEMTSDLKGLTRQEAAVLGLLSARLKTAAATAA
jgi:DNA topoisomerase-1